MIFVQTNTFVMQSNHLPAMTNKTLISTHLTFQSLKPQGSYWLRHPHKPRPYFPKLGDMVHLPLCVMHLFCYLPYV